jgi:flagellar biogenesis protein FliO
MTAYGNKDSWQRRVLIGVALGLAVLVGSTGAWAGSSRSGSTKTRPIADADASRDKDASPVKADLGRDDPPLFAKGRAGIGTRDDDRPSPSKAQETPREADGAALDAKSLGAPAGKVSVLDVAGKLGAILLCVYGLATGLRLFKGRGFSWPRQTDWLRPRGAEAEPTQLRVMESLPLGPNRRLYLVEANGHVLLLGADATGLASLGDLGKDKTSVPTPLPGAERATAATIVAPGDTSEFTPAASPRREMRADPLASIRRDRVEDAAPATRTVAHERRDEESWARKRDILIRALRDKIEA